MTNEARGSDYPRLDIDKLYGEGRFTGSVLYSIHGRVLLKAGYGLSERSSGRENEPGTSFQIASVSKQFTAAAILLLVEEGKISVHDKIARWLPEPPSVWKDITIHHLLTHTSGLPHWRDIPSLDLFNPVDEERILSAFSGCPLRFHPGEGWYYSSPGYHLLSLIVQEASGQRYHDFLSGRIFGPLEMTRTSAGFPVDPSRSATGYDGESSVASFDLCSTGMGAGDVWSTVEDLARWDTALSQPGKILSERSLEATFFPHAQFSGENLEKYDPLTGVAYGYGWFLGLLHAEPLRFHTGDNPGYRAINAWEPGSRAIISILSNQESVDVATLAIQCLNNAAHDNSN